MNERSLAALLASSLIFVLTYAGIFSGRIHRTIVAFAGAVLMIAIGGWLNFYDMPRASAAIDFDTISLLLGMMIMVGILGKTGLFSYLAVRAAQFTKGSPWRLMIALGLLTTVVSMVLDNVTTIMVVAPVTLSIAEVMEITPIPFLIGEAILSNTGGVATLIGDPPNILIGSAAGLTFNDFLIHLAPIVLVAWLVTQGVLTLVFWRDLRQPAHDLATLAQLDARRALVDPKTAKRMLIILGGTILLYLIHDRIGLIPGMVALIGASIGLMWIRPPIEEVMHEIHWDVLLFFISLFVVVGGLDSAGMLGLIAHGVTGITRHGMTIAALVVMWSGALMSAVVDNIPFTMAMIPIIAGLGATGVEIGPLWWALALGVGFGGNGTPIGSTANVVTVSLSERTDHPITFHTWIRSGSIAAFACLIVGSIALILAIEFGFM